jgi:hypothetical protein
MSSPLNPAAVLVVTYEYLFCLSSSERPQPPARWKSQGLLSRYCTLGTTGHRVWPNKSGYDPVPSSGKQLGNHIPCTRYDPTTPS